MDIEEKENIFMDTNINKHEKNEYQKTHVGQRCSKRFNVRLKSVILSKQQSYAGYLENVSNERLAYTMSNVNYTSQDFAPEKIIKLIFLTPFGETLNLNCEIIWTSALLPDYVTFCMGMKIIEPPSEYRKYITTLH
jgi:hypothetical protein